MKKLSFVGQLRLAVCNKQRKVGESIRWDLLEKRMQEAADQGHTALDLHEVSLDSLQVPDLSVDALRASVVEAIQQRYEGLDVQVIPIPQPLGNIRWYLRCSWESKHNPL